MASLLMLCDKNINSEGKTYSDSAEFLCLSLIESMRSERCCGRKMLGFLHCVPIPEWDF